MALKKDDFVNGLEWRTFRFTFERFKGECDLKLLSEKNLCYPFVNVDNKETKLSKGKQLIYYCKKFGVENHMKKIGCTRSFYKEHLYGIAYFVKMINVERGKRYLEQLDLINWSY